jgi:hypothetical protein
MRAIWVYFILDLRTRFIKIGITRDIERRLREIIRVTGHPCRFIGAIHGGRDVEAELHRRYAAHATDQAEWFAITERDAIEQIEMHAYVASRQMQLDFEKPKVLPIATAPETKPSSPWVFRSIVQAKEGEAA